MAYILLTQVVGHPPPPLEKVKNQKILHNVMWRLEVGNSLNIKTILESSPNLQLHIVGVLLLQVWGKV